MFNYIKIISIGVFEEKHYGTNTILLSVSALIVEGYMGEIGKKNIIFISELIKLLLVANTQCYC